jgi:hypothetical protein
MLSSNSFLPEGRGLGELKTLHEEGFSVDHVVKEFYNAV